MSDTSKPNLAEEAAGFAADATIDTAADRPINAVIDAVAEHVPGGQMIDQVAKTGIDLAANNAINAEVGKIEGMLGHHAEAPPEN
jgi:hypothetical protein